MPWKIAGVVGVAATLFVVGCGSSKKSSSSSSVSNGYASEAQLTTSTPALTRSYTYRVKLAGENEVPKGAPNASGIAVVTLRSKTNQVCWKFSALSGVTSPTASHIHGGAAGTSGPVVIAFAPPYKPSGCVGARASLLARIAATPHSYYVNIHNAKYPAGVVRAQL